MTRTILRAALLTLGLAACSTPSAYGPALENGGIGYREQQIESARYRISYRGTNFGEADSGALRRAAELTIGNGYDWFTVVSRDVTADDSRRSGSSIGIGTGSQSGNVGVGVGVQLPLGGGGERPVTVRLEILMGRGVSPGGPESYNARDVLQNLVPN